MQQAQAEEGKYEFDEDELEEDVAAERAEVVAAGGNLAGVKKASVAKKEAGGGRPIAFSPTKDVVNEHYNHFAQKQRIPENEAWIGSRSGKSFVYLRTQSV